VRLAEALVEALKLLDVRYVFGVSGANIEHLHDAIHRLGEGRLRSVLAKGEAGAAFMADGHARVHRSLAVCASTSGGGMVNLIAGLAESYQSSSPVLAIVGQPPTSLRGRGAFQDSSGVGRSVSALGLLGALTKYVRELTDPEEFWPSLDAAIIAALSNRQGSSALLIPRDLYEREVPAPAADWPARILGRAKPPPVAQESLVRVLELVRGASRPMLLIGQGIRRSRNPDAVRSFAERTRIPVATTMSARAEYPNDAPNYLGVLGAAGHPSVQSYLCDEADLVLAVGASMNAMTSAPLFRSARGLAGKTLIVVNPNLDDVQRALGASSMAPNRAGDGSRLPALLVGVEADAGPSFETLNELWDREPFVVAELERECLQFTPTLARELKAAGQPPSDLLQSDALGVLARYLPETGHVLYDAGNCAAAALHYLPVPTGLSATIALGMGGMGYAVAASVGVQLGSPAGSRTIVFAGDGAFFVSGFEVHTAVELELPILYVIFNNSMHGMCVTRQQLYFDARIESSTYGYVDVAQVARGFASPERLWVGKATTVYELEAALQEYAQASNRPGVLEIVTAREQLPPFSPFLPTGAGTQAMVTGK